MSSERQAGIYGPGSFTDTSFVPVPEDCKRILYELASRTPNFTQVKDLLDGVNFVGHDLPPIPGPIKSAAVTAVLHAMAGIIGHEILALRGVSTDQKTTINTDAAGLWLNSIGAVWVDGAEKSAALEAPNLNPEMSKAAVDSALKLRSQAIYPTATPNVWYQTHGSANPWDILRSLGVDPDQPNLTGDEAYEAIKTQTLKMAAGEIELIQLEHGYPGSVVYNPEQWRQTMMGKALAKHPLVNFNQVQFTENIKPAAWGPMTPGDTRPLAGIKVLELARVIAAPACGAILASMGAQVIRVNTTKKVDFTPAQLTLMAGKTTYDLDINDPEGRQRVKELISEADVVIQGYRLRSLERRGLGQTMAMEAAARRGRGMIWLDENCYGPDGYYAERPGWQQVADAAAGSSYVMGKAFGFPEGQGILPCLPISDMSTGAICAVTIMSMIRDRAKYGGSWYGCASLTAYDAATLEPWVGLYQPEVVERIQEEFQFRTWGSDIHVIELYYQIFDDWKKTPYLMDEGFYTHFSDSVYGKDLKIVAPIVKYSDSTSSPRWTSPPVPFCYHPYNGWSS